MLHGSLCFLWFKNSVLCISHSWTHIFSYNTGAFLYLNAVSPSHLKSFHFWVCCHPSVLFPISPWGRHPWFTTILSIVDFKENAHYHYRLSKFHIYVLVYCIGLYLSDLLHIGMGNTCKSMADSCQCVTEPLQYGKVISLQLIKINGKKNKENAQSESCKLSFIWGTVRTAAWETASQMSEKLLSSGKPLQRGEVDRGGQYICEFGWRGIHAIKHVYFQKVSTSLMKL